MMAFLAGQTWPNCESNRTSRMCILDNVYVGIKILYE